MFPFRNTLRCAVFGLCAAALPLTMIGCDAAPSDSTDTAQTTDTTAQTEAVTLSPEQEAALAMYNVRIGRRTTG